MNKYIKLFVSFTIVVACFYTNIDTTKAANFEGREEEMLRTCKRNNLTKSERATCTEFKSYINEKNKDVKNKINDTKNNVDQTKEQMLEVSKQIKEIESSIAIKNDEISYLEQDIQKTESEISKKDSILKKRMYEMQTYVNTNQFINFILGAANFSDLFSRIENVNEITEADKRLIKELNTSKQQLIVDKQSLEDAKVALEQTKQTLYSKKEELNRLVEKYQSDWESLKAVYDASSKDVAEMNAAIQASMVREDELNKVREDINNGTVTGSVATVLNAALSKKGCPYVWGATGPNAFDCSGLTQWSYAQAGIRIGRTTWDQIYNGRAVSRSELAPGDLVFFHTMDDRPPTHVGIYLGDGTFIHAPNESTPVSVSYLSGYWISHYYGARRIIE